MLKLTTIIFVKFICLWFTLLTSAILATSLLSMNTQDIATNGPLSGGQAFLLVNALHAAVLALLASRAQLRGLMLAILIASTLFFAQSFLLLMEALYFIDNLNLSKEVLIQSMEMALIIAVCVGGVSAFLWRSVANKPAPLRLTPILGLRIFGVAILYVASYFIAGYFIAWASEHVRAYYDFGESIKLFPLLSFQLLRGGMWGILALFIAHNLSGSLMSRALIVGANFSILATAQLLYPSFFMPWEVRLPHLIEVGISNFIFGGLAVLILQYSYHHKLKNI